MSVQTVAWDDFRNARRSYVVLGVIGVFALLVGLVFAAEIDIYDHPYRTLFDASFLVGYGFPLFVAPLTYLAIAGDRSSGTIKYALGLPNSRLEYFTAKYVSRVSVAVAAVLVSTLVGFVIAAATFTNSPDPVRFLKFGAASALFAVAIAGTFVSLSAMVESRSRAMFAVIGAYFLLIPFWQGNVLPLLNITTLLDFADDTLGVALSDSTRHLIRSLSPTQAYWTVTQIVYEGLGNTPYEMLSFVGEPRTELHEKTWFGALVLTAWATVPAAVAYVKFRVSELG